MSITIDGRTSISYATDNNNLIIRITKKHKDNYTLAYCQGEHITDNITKSEAENVLNYMKSKYFSNI